MHGGSVNEISESSKTHLRSQPAVAEDLLATAGCQPTSSRSQSCRGIDRGIERGGVETGVE